MKYLTAPYYVGVTLPNCCYKKPNQLLITLLTSTSDDITYPEYIIDLDNRIIPLLSMLLLVKKGLLLLFNHC